MTLEEIAPGLTRHDSGYWLAPDEAPVCYPADGNDFCFAVEEESFWFAHRNRVITAAVRRRPPANGPIFDVGAGNGFVAAALQQAGFPTVAIEPNRTGAAHAARRGVEQVVCGALPSSAFRHATAGAIGLFDVVEHVQDDCGFLTSLRPYLNLGGRLYITTPAYPRLWSVTDVRSGHFRRYTLATMEQLLTSAGYRIEYATYIFWMLPLPILLFRTLRRTDASPDGRCTPSPVPHTAGGKFIRRLAERCFAFEVRRVESGSTVPFGGSCLVVATPARA